MTELDRVSAIEWLKSALDRIDSNMSSEHKFADLNYKIRQAKALLEKKE